MELLIITGNQVQEEPEVKYFEDIGYFCVDNLAIPDSKICRVIIHGKSNHENSSYYRYQSGAMF